MIVAHPDDEVIFGGANLIAEKGWKVICVTNGGNKVRSKEFKKVMDDIGATYEIWKYKDQWGGDFNRKALKRDIKKILRDNPQIKIIVTHNKRGEYGHTQHKALHKIVKEIAGDRLFIFKRSKQRLSSKTLKRKYKLLDRYQSQNIKWLKKYIEYESIRKHK